MSSPEKKRKTITKPESTRERKMETMNPNPLLPDDLLLSCIARVSRSYYPTFSLVSKSFQSLLTSPELYKTRSLLGHADNCLYVCLVFPPNPNPRWFTLSRIPDLMKKKKKNSSGNFLVPISIPSSPNSPHLLAMGSNIYKIGVEVSSSSSVYVLDCKSHTWHQAPSMRVGRTSSSTVSLLDGKIYVAGGCQDRNSVNWVEVFDPKTQTWSSVTRPVAEIRSGGVAKHKSIGLEGKFYLFGVKSGVYDPKDGQWNPVGYYINMGIAPYFSYCIIDEVLFYWFNGFFSWYDYKVKVWKKLNGLECLPEKLWNGLNRYQGLPDFSNLDEVWRCKMVNYGGKMAVLWDESDDVYQQQNRIWCAEIALERRHGDEIWGKVEWFDVVLTVPKSCQLFKGEVLSTTV